MILTSPLSVTQSDEISHNYEDNCTCDVARKEKVKKI